MTYISWTLRSLVTFLHVLISVGAAIGVIYPFARWKCPEQCLSPMIGLFNDKHPPFSVSRGVGICQSVLGALIINFFLNLSMVAFANCLWTSGSILFLHLLISLVIGGFNVFGASLFSIYKLIWCSNLTEKMETNNGCFQAAKIYDNLHGSSNMTHYYERQRIEEVGVWCMVPVTFLLILVYAMAFRHSKSSGYELRASQEEDCDTNIRSDYMSIDETTPLLINE